MKYARRTDETNHDLLMRLGPKGYEIARLAEAEMGLRGIRSDDSGVTRAIEDGIEWLMIARFRMGADLKDGP